MVTEENAGKKVCWVLGSGFSKSLGGPLLNELFSTKAAIAIHSRGRSAWQRGDVVRLYNQHITGTGNSLWEHAEEFMEFLDLAVANPALSKQIVGETDRAKMMRGACARTVAEECNFADYYEQGREGWAPYARWKKHHLDENHSVLTFNYDRVPECLEKEIWFK